MATVKLSEAQGHILNQNYLVHLQGLSSIWCCFHGSLLFCLRWILNIYNITKNYLQYGQTCCLQTWILQTIWCCAAWVVPVAHPRSVSECGAWRRSLLTRPVSPWMAFRYQYRSGWRQTNKPEQLSQPSQEHSSERARVHQRVQRLCGAFVPSNQDVYDSWNSEANNNKAEHNRWQTWTGLAFHWVLCCYVCIWMCACAIDSCLSVV